MNSSGSSAAARRAAAPIAPIDLRHLPLHLLQIAPAAPRGARVASMRGAGARGLRGILLGAWLVLGGTGMTAHAQTATAYTDDTPAVDAAISSQQWPQALHELDARIASHADDVQAQFKRGTVLARMGRREEAIQAFEGLIERHPELPEPYNNLAALYAQAGRLDDARVTLESALRAHPGFTLAYRNLGDVYLKLAQLAYERSGDAVGTQRAGQIATLVRQAPATTPPRAKRSVDSAGNGTGNGTSDGADEEAGPSSRESATASDKSAHFPSTARQDTSISTTVPVRP
ncbi:tetratricopeptide repeat protein [Chitinasiproducens palmae]|uniref:Tetratricopeptide repeat-containing protein n=1 Tax=Chitinasiproducens palmae TaxID=1770053 RepID=A0A1H2PTQ8_9BURK|nr:tetratricopeptide repeat protein [Chitinasiproducens palmae]SDV49665.1 Tetratricopeptide repeat-containing protein [Chitinasiproducens palmae]